MAIKLIAFDLDGTALHTHKQLPPENQKALMRAGEKGIILVPATGRICGFIPTEIVPGIPYINYAITSNGGATYETRTHVRVHSATLSAVKTKAIQKVLGEYAIYTEYYVDGIAYSRDRDIEKAKAVYNLPESKFHFLTKNYEFVDDFICFASGDKANPEKINLPYLPTEIRNEVRSRLNEIEGLELTSSIADNLEINDAMATKGYALEALCKLLNISSNECMAIGDSGNDISMLKFAKYSVAMGNSTQEVFNAATYRTATCEENGMAVAIKKFAL